jgi:hypothetical protein
MSNCPKCYKGPTIEHNGELWCPDCAEFIKLLTPQYSFCPKCQKDSLIEHGDRQWCPDCAEFVTPPVQLPPPPAMGSSPAMELPPVIFQRPKAVCSTCHGTGQRLCPFCHGYPHPLLGCVRCMRAILITCDECYGSGAL